MKRRNLERIARSSLIVTALVALVSLLGCGGGTGESVVIVDWQARDDAPLATSLNAEAVQTVVYVTNTTGRTLRDVTLRLPPINGGPPDLTFGTVAVTRTLFEEDAYVWQLGDIAPNVRLVFPLGLWFDSSMQHQGEMSLELSIEVSSADLETAVLSNKLLIAASSP